MKKSVYLLRTNPLLTTNVKLICDTDYNLYLESYNTNSELSNSKYKKVLISSDSFISERIATFYTDLPSSIAFDIRQNAKSDTVQTSLNLQYDDIYMSGPRQVEDTRYKEEFQYNTTLKINPDHLPKNFVILRADGPGLGKDNLGNNIEINDIDIKNCKLVKIFNLDKSTNIGKLFQKNYIDDDVIPRSPFELNLKQFEFSRWNGYDYKTGGSTSKSLFLDDYIRNQNTHFEIEKFITSGFQKNEVICSNYLNVSFLYDDTVSGLLMPSTTYNLNGDYKFLNESIFNGDYKIGTDISTPIVSNTEPITANFQLTQSEPISYRKKWTINRYYGFYLDDLIEFKKISPYIPVSLNTDNISVYNNMFVDSTQIALSNVININPLNEIWDVNKIYHIKIKDTYYLIERNEIFDTNGVLLNTQYIIVSDVIFGKDAIGINSLLLFDLINGYLQPIKIIYNTTYNLPELVYINNNLVDFTFDEKIKYVSNIDNVVTQDNQSLVLLKIFDDYFVVKYVQEGIGPNFQYRILLSTDWYITCDGNKLIKKYANNKVDTIFTQVLSKNYDIPYFKFYSCQFTTINDFDFDRVTTRYANIENDNKFIVNNYRPFLHETDILDTSYPKDFVYENNYKIKLSLGIFPIFYPFNLGESFILPSTSEYAVTGDLYMLNEKKTLTEIWNGNQSINKWGYLNSLNYVGYPYKLNNNLDFSNPFNFTPNYKTLQKSSTELSLDWFYTPGAAYRYNGSNIVGTTDQDPVNQIIDNIIVFRNLNVDLNIMQDQVPTNKPQFYDYEKFDIEYYKNSTSKFNYFNYFFNNITDLNKITGNTRLNPIAGLPIKFTQKTALFNKPDNINGSIVFFKGFNASLFWTQLDNPNKIDKMKLIQADVTGYEFCIYFDTKETVDDNLWGTTGIEFIVNKIHKNVLVYMFMYTPLDAYTNLHFTKRDNLYDIDTITYSYNISNTLPEQWITVNTKLSTQALKLNSIYNIVTNNLLSTDDFNTITYTLIDDTKKYYLINSGVSNVVNSSINGYDITILSNDYLPFRHGDYIYINFGSLKGNYKVSKVISKNSLIVELDNVLSVPVLASTFYIQNNISILPFKFVCINSETIKIDTGVNITTVSELNLPITPDNQLSNINGEIDNGDVNDINNNYDIDYVWSGNPLTRRIQRINKISDLTYKQLDDLPTIERYSGDYEPIHNNVELFEKANLFEYNIDRTNINNKILYSYLNSDLEYVIEFCSKDLGFTFNIPDSFNVGDLIYITKYDSRLSLTPINYQLHHRMVEITKVELTIDNGPGGTIANIYKVTTNLKFDSIPVGWVDYNLNIPDRFASGIGSFSFKIINANTYFSNKLIDYGMINEHIISKYNVDTNKLLKSSNPIYNDTNKYPMSDEHGMTNVKRNIFKSNWDINFYYNLLKNKYNQ